jgi:uncharacterized protein with GYD domain
LTHSPGRQEWLLFAREMKQFYMVMGEFDFVGICEAPDDAVMARYVLQLGGLGFVRTNR